MQTKVKVTATYNCSLERAFKTPLLCDTSKVHTGFIIMPKLTHCTDDENWGQIGSSQKKKKYLQQNLFYKKAVLPQSIKCLSGLKINTGNLKYVNFNTGCWAFLNLQASGKQQK
ncbi:MAG: hypothetical protein ACK5Z2_13270 [Bacteroidota bacterium]|jgi:hypothetical protein